MKHTEETKQKIRKTLKEKGGNSGTFKKGNVAWNKGKKNPKVSGEKNNSWKGGILRGYSYKFKDNKCTICGDKKKLQTHHINGNIKENSWKNISTLCSYCHYGVHDNGKNTRFGGSI